jgi:hypothetical protein
MPTDELARRKAQTTAVFDALTPHYDTAGVGCFAYFGRLLVERTRIQRWITDPDQLAASSAGVRLATRRRSPVPMALRQSSK